MINKLLVLITFFIGFTQVHAQDAEKDAKAADKALSRYYMNNNDMAKLAEAKSAIDKAFTAGASSAEAYMTRGEIYAQYGNADALMKQLNPNSPLKQPEAPLIAYDSYVNAFNKFDKQRDKTKVLEKLAEVLNSLNNAGSEALSAQDFEKSFQNFNGMLNILNLYKTAGMKSPLQKEEDNNNVIYITALTAFNSNHIDEATKLYNLAYDSGFKTAGIYDGLYRVYEKTDLAKASAFLSEGRKAFPDDNNLLFSQINLSLKQGKLDALIGDLKMAMEKEPENVSVINTMANVYDQLYQSAKEKNDTVKATEYQNNALKYYNEALKKDPKNSLALYSIGTIYYNQAAEYIKKMNELDNDLSSAGLKKYAFFKDKTDGAFDKALPYFLQAEVADPTDKNTLIALKEIYARKDQLDKSKEYKLKLEKLGE